MTSLLSKLLLAGVAAAAVAIPPLESRVTDLTATLEASQKEALEKTLAEFEARKGAQIAVLMVPTTQPETIEQYAVRVEEQWKLGRKGVDDSVLLVVALNSDASARATEATVSFVGSASAHFNSARDSRQLGVR